MLQTRSHTMAAPTTKVSGGINLQKGLLGYKQGLQESDSGEDRMSDFSYHSYASAQDYKHMHKRDGPNKFRSDHDLQNMLNV